MELVTVFGSTGFVGSHFVMDEDYTFHCPERYSRRPAAEANQIVNFVSTTHNYNVFDDATLDVKTNLLHLTETLDSWRANAPHAIYNFISSWFVYGNVPIPAHEEDYCNPKGFYSITKRAAEQLVISYAEAFNLKYRILRLGNVLGSGDKNVSAKKNALQYLFNKMKAGEDIDIYERGDFYRSYIHIRDCTHAISLVMNKGKTNEIYNIGTTEKIKFIDMLLYAAKLLDYKGKFNFIDQKGFHKKVQAKSFLLDVTKLYDLGFQHVYDFEHMIEDVINP
jgi:nucleoside-diphosphate-sugar epimerase